jgi:NADH-quinone oxidoreductase subunit H
MSIASIVFLPIVSFFLGIIYGYEIRKVSARLQSRRGPWLLVPKSLRGPLGVTRLFQPLYDIIKLLCKESLLPSTSTKGLFRLSPYIALVCVIVAAAFTPVATYSHLASFELSLVVILYLLLGVPDRKSVV